MDSSTEPKTINNSPVFFTKTRLLLAIVIYSPFFGYSYLKGYLHGAGFSNPHIEAAPQELIFQAITALGEIFSRLAKGDIFVNIAKEALTLGIAFAILCPCVFIVFRLTKKHIESNKLDIKKPNISDIIQNVAIWLYSRPKVVIKFFSTAIFGFIFGFLASYLSLFITTFAMSLVLLMMIFGNIVGTTVGKELTQNDICIKKKAEPQETQRLGCNIIRLTEPFRDKKEIKGWRLYSSSNTSFFLTNDGAYEIGSDLKVKLFTPNQKFNKGKQQQKPVVTPTPIASQPSP